MPHTSTIAESLAAFRRLDRLIWTLIAAVCLVVVVAPLISTFSVDWPTFAAPVSAALTLGAISWFYRSLRPDPRLASALENTAQLIAFAAVGAPLSYLAAAAALPLQDHVF